MKEILGFLVLLSFMLFIIGILMPKVSLFWYKKERTRGKSASIYLTIFIISAVLIPKDKNKFNTNKIEKTAVVNETKEVNASNEIKIGQVLKTEYFDIVVNKVNLNDRVNTGNEFTDIKPEPKNRFLIINASFKNTNNESRYVIDGSVWINYNGKDYEFSKSESILLDGWGLLLEEINPLTTKTTNLVYKIPVEIKGNAYWQPGRADSDQKILLGTL